YTAVLLAATTSTRGFTASASPIASMTLTVAGMPRCAKGGAMTRNATMRTPTSMSDSSEPSARLMVMGSAAEEAGDACEEVVRERDHLGDHPVPADEDRERHGDGLGHEAQGHLLDLRDRLQEGDGKTDDE